MQIKSIFIALSLAALGVSLASCGQTVDPGNVGVKIAKFATGPNGGIDPTPMTNGWHMLGFGERIVEYPTIERSYAYTKEPSKTGGGSDQNEEISFTDHTGLPIYADMQVVLRVEQDKVPSLYQRWRLSFDDLFMTPIRNDIRAAVAAESEQIPVDQLYSGGREGVAQRALARVQKKWAPQGVIISQLDFLGQLRYPDSVISGITAKSQVEQATLAAQGQVAKAKAEADAKIESARGDAESAKLKGDALKANPEVIRQLEIERWSGTGCPIGAKTCILGGAALAQVQTDDSK